MSNFCDNYHSFGYVSALFLINVNYPLIFVRKLIIIFFLLFIPPINGNEIVRFNCFLTKFVGDEIVQGEEFGRILGNIEQISFKTNFIC